MRDGGEATAESYGRDALAEMDGRVCVVTGANRGLGLATTRALAALGATVVMVCRDRAQGEAAAASMRPASGRSAPEVVEADLASLASVRAAAEAIMSRHAEVHALVNNAGVHAARRELTVDGVERTLAVNHLAPFVLTRALLPALTRAARPGRSARVVTVTSVFERFGRIAFGNLDGARHYLGMLAYTQSKHANVLFTRALAARLAGTGVTATCVDPGLVATDLLRERWWYRAPGLRSLWRRVLLTPDDGARAAVLAVASSALEGVTGECVDRRGRVMRTSGRSRDRGVQERLWEVSERLAGQ